MLKLVRLPWGLPEPSFAEENGGLSVCLYFAPTAQKARPAPEPQALSPSEREILDLILKNQAGQG